MTHSYRRESAETPEIGVKPTTPDATGLPNESSDKDILPKQTGVSEAQPTRHVQPDSAAARPRWPDSSSRLKLLLETIAVVGVLVAAGALVIQIVQYREQVAEWEVDRIVRRQTLINLAWANITRSIEAGATGEQGQIEALELLLGQLGASGIGIDLRNGYFEGLDLSEAFDASLAYARLDGITLIDAKLPDMSFTAASLKGARMGGADLTGSDLSVIHASEANLTNLVAPNALLSGSNFIDAFFGAANLAGASMAGANLWGAEFREGASLDGVNLSNVLLVDAVLEGVSLVGATFNGAILNGTVIRSGRGVQAKTFGGACYHKRGATLRIIKGSVADVGPVVIVEERRSNEPPVIDSLPGGVPICEREEGVYYAFTEWPMTYHAEDPALAARFTPAGGPPER